MLFSATQTKKVEDLARVSIDKGKAVYVEVPSETGMATAAGLEQGYVTVPSELRFLLLFTFLKKNKNKKVMVSATRTRGFSIFGRYIFVMTQINETLTSHVLT